ncbi:hypothetical protein [Sodalis sp. RH19]|uniref:hypothetical protein n=1 Tax=Sodalis sp. RH19 TaxID=3394334 RepID=UPI0039B5BB0A
MIDDRRPQETWENFLNEFPGATVRENDIDRVLGALFDAPPASGRIAAAEAPGGSRLYGARETDPLRLFTARADDASVAEHGPGALPPADIATGGVTPAQRRAMLAALGACLGTLSQNDADALFTQTFLPVYQREMTHKAC